MRPAPVVELRPVAGAGTLQIGETRASYHGKTERVVVLVIAGQAFNLGLADTARCAVDLGSCRRTLSNVAERAQQFLGDAIERAAEELQARCRELTKWKERQPRY